MCVAQKGRTEQERGLVVVERLLLNVLLSLTPVFGYQLVMFRHAYERDAQAGQWLIGALSGLASILCMMFPVVLGNNFLWDMRWTSFLLAVLYGGWRGGGLCAMAMLVYRACLPGWTSWLFVLLDVAVLFPFLLVCKRFMERRLRAKARVFASALVAVISFVLVETSIYFYFVVTHKAAFFLHQGVLFFIVYGLVTVIGCAVYVILIEGVFRQLQIQRELLQTETSHIINDLAASFAHEIRNPLTVAKGFMQILRESLNDESQHFSDIAITELDRAESIISEYLHLARPQMTEPAVLSLRDTLSNIVEMMAPFAVLHNVKLTCQVDRDASIFVDLRHFKQIMLNIVKNAIESIPDGGRVSLSAWSGGQDVVIHVSDTGIGMSKAQLGRLGKPFYSTKSKGTGLGLMVTFRLAESMGGRLEFTSVEGVGTKAILHLPLYRVPQRSLFVEGPSLTQ